MKISVCGKGGSGKSTLVNLLARQAVARGRYVIVIDADESNTGLSRLLGFDQPPTPLMALAGGKKAIRDKIGRSPILSQDTIRVGDIPAPYLQHQNGLAQVSIGKILQSLEGCACPMGVLSREFLKKLKLDDGMIALVDMEAGVEHFGRGIEEGIDRVLLMVDPSLESLEIAARIRSLAGAMGKAVAAVLSKVPSPEIAGRLRDELGNRGIDVLGTLPNDPLVFEAGLEGRGVAEGTAFDAAGRILETLLT
jgi:CO dehydrogenase maturation factor